MLQLKRLKYSKLLEKGRLFIMNSTNNEILLNAATTILESAETLQKGDAIGKEAMKNFARFSASVHSFQVYTFIDPAFETLEALTTFKKAITAYEEHYVKLRNTIDEKMDQKAAKIDYDALGQALTDLEKALTTL